MTNFTATNIYIFKDKHNKKWCIRYTLQKNGVTTYPMVYGKEYDTSLNKIKDLKEREYEAEILLKMVKRDLDAGILPNERKVKLEKDTKQRIEDNHQFKYDEVIEWLITTKGWRTPRPNQKNSKTNLTAFYKNQFRNYVESIGKLHDIRLITIDDIETFIEEGKKDKIVKKEVNVEGKQVEIEVLVEGWKSGQTVNNKLNWISIIYSTSIKKRKLTVNPTKGIERAKTVQVSATGDKLIRFQVFTIREVEILFEHLNKVNFPFLVFAMCIYHGFMRLSEIMRLKVWMVDFENQRFILPPDVTKNGAKTQVTEYVYLPPVLEAALRKYLSDKFGDNPSPEALLYTKVRDENEEMIIQYADEVFNEVFEELGKQHKGMFINKVQYGLKHSGCSHFITRNMKSKNHTSMEILEYIKKQSRHADFSTTQKYISNDLGLVLDEEKTVFIY